MLRKGSSKKAVTPAAAEVVGYRESTMDTEKIKQLSKFPGFLKDPSVVGLLWVEDQQMPI